MKRIPKLTKQFTRNLCTKCNQNNCLCQKQWQSHLATDSEQIIKAEQDQYPYDNSQHPNKHIPELIQKEKSTNIIRHIQDNQIQHQININNEINNNEININDQLNNKLNIIKDVKVKEIIDQKRDYYKFNYENFEDDEF